MQRDAYIGLGVLALAAALAIPFLIPTPRLSGDSGFGEGGVPFAPGTGPVTLDTAVSRVKEVLAGSGYVDLVPAEIMEFSNHFYVAVVEKGTHVGAMELIVERDGTVHPEPGPNMMWNTKYGHGGTGAIARGFGGMRDWGWRGGTGGHCPWCWFGPAQRPTVTKDQAHEIAAQYLASAFPGDTPSGGVAFFGYYTFDSERDGKPTGMLSVNAYTGQVWFHTWHGVFILERDLQEEG